MNPGEPEDPEEILDDGDLLEGGEDDEGVVLKLLVPNNMVGSIIGKGGETIKDITAQTSAKIHIAQGDDVSPERMVTITGNLANVSRAQFQISYKMLEEAFAEIKVESPKPLEQRISLLPLKVIIPNSVVGRLIGKGGTNLKRTMAETDTFLTCSKEDEFPRLIGERVVTIVGSVENQNRAQASVLQQIKQYTQSQPTGGPAQQQQPSQAQQPQSSVNGSPPLHHKATSPLVYDQTYGGAGLLRTPHAPYAAYPPRAMVQIPAYAPNPVGGIPLRVSGELQDQEETLCVQVPNGVIGSIIGKKGMTVRDISSRSGCNVKVARNNEVDMNAAYRPITLVGSIDSLFNAQRLLYSKITEAPPAVGGGADQPLRVDITIPNEVVGRVIGKKGSQVKKITEMSGARITINQDEEGEAIGTLVSIIGSLESNIFAQTRIFQILSYHSASE